MSFFCLCLLFCFEIMTTNAVFPAILGFFKRGAIIADAEKGLPAIREMFCSFFFSPQRPFFPKPLSVCHFLLVLVSFSVFHFKIPRFCFRQPLLSYYSRFVSLVFSLLPLCFLCFCLVPSQFPAIPFSNPPCFHFWSFRSSILPLCTLGFSGLALPFFFLLLFFSCWFLCGFLLTVVVTFFITGDFVLSWSKVCLVSDYWHLKRVFSLRFWWVSSKMFDFRFRSGCAATFVFGVLRVNEKMREKMTGRILALN